MSQTVVVIPARMASQRLPGKPLLDLTGKPMICHVVDQARQARSVSRVIVAADDDRIIDAVRRQGAEAVMTRADHPNGTSRIAEVAQGLGPEVSTIVNVQGDEPEIDPQLIDALIARHRGSGCPMSTLVSPFGLGEDPADPNVVKVVVDQMERAIYFSRSRIPFDRDAQGHNPLKHLGLYAYDRAFLPVYVALPATPYEQIEKLEQLRAIEHGHRIAVARVQVGHQGIDTPAQYEAFVARWHAGAASR